MRWTHVLAVGAVASIGLTAACSAPSKTATGGSNGNATSAPVEQAGASLDPNAKGPAPRDANAKNGGTLTVSYSTSPSSMDPSAQFYQDSGAIMTQLTMRSLTTFVNRGGKEVLVPDLATDLGQVSSDRLTWTFKLKSGIKYSDGSAVSAKDVAYAVKRSFAFTATGPTYQVDFLKDGDKYQGPYKSGDTFAGVEAPDDSTVVFHLSKPWETLPYFTTFTQVSPIPQAKDTKDESYGDKALATGPYVIDSFTQGSELKLKKNPYWDPNSDPARTQYVDGYDFKFGTDTVQTQTAILASNGPDATTLNWEGIDSSLVSQIEGAKKSQFVEGPSSCTVTQNLDTRKIPMPVRKALAVAMPWDAMTKAAGLSTHSASPAHTLIPPQIPGWLDYTLDGVTGQGNGDPAKAKEMLSAAGYGADKPFELKYYYTNDDPIAQQTNQAKKQGLEAAGFKVTDLGVPGKERRKLIADPNAQTNMGQSPAGWCFDWPSADSIFPPTVASTQLKQGGTNWGDLSDSKVDAELARISKLSIADQGPEWGKFDKWLMENYLPALPWYWDKSNIVFGTKVHNVINDPNHGTPILNSIWVDS
ncbi:ABC transporter substrate-binding protein [Lapillicoccus jejuensis]|uniref:Peptide/nickel transport system substrate-binding protein n=1 Tax=Lapillicoccus jejuensis TaxID=402171 RepID=A0A542E6J7_9MICO|nr:ABC transporter substrate-binding protein [Lapillicoccus jejuensis]TQJ10951.1 peptide/nickel transport system substrate-binding protein [Lapillicoccus jejuensis]